MTKKQFLYSLTSGHDRLGEAQTKGEAQLHALHVKENTPDAECLSLRGNISVTPKPQPPLELHKDSHPNYVEKEKEP